MEISVVNMTSKLASWPHGYFQNCKGDGALSSFPAPRTFREPFILRHYPRYLTMAEKILLDIMRFVVTHSFINLITHEEVGFGH